MLDSSKNQLLTQVGPGTPMGDLLRRYWMPIAAVSRVRRQDHQAGPPAGRGSDSLQGSERHVWAGRPPVPASPRRHILRLRGTVRAALQLPWLAVRPGRPVHRATLRGRCRARGSLQGQGPDQGLSGRDQGRPDLGLPGPRAGSAGPQLGALHVEERLRADRLRGRPLQLASMPGEFDRSAALRVDAHELERPVGR